MCPLKGKENGEQLGTTKAEISKSINTEDMKEEDLKQDMKMKDEESQEKRIVKEGMTYREEDKLIGSMASEVVSFPLKGKEEKQFESTQMIESLVKDKKPENVESQRRWQGKMKEVVVKHSESVVLRKVDGNSEHVSRFYRIEFLEEEYQFQDKIIERLVSQVEWKRVGKEFEKEFVKDFAESEVTMKGERKEVRCLQSVSEVEESEEKKLT